MRSRCRRCVALTFLIVMGAVGSVAEGQLWKQFAPAPKSAANKPAAAANGDFALTQENGPWLIMATSFSGSGAEQQANELAQELRERYHLRAYVNEMSFSFSEEAPGRGLDGYGAPIRRRYQRGDHVQEFAVLIGDFQTIDDPEAQKTLENIKTMQPDALNMEAGKTAQSLAQLRQLEDAVFEKMGRSKKRGPMAKAFLTRNRLLPREYFVPKGVDDFVAKMNRGVENNLLTCPGKFTVQVATFRGKTILQTSGKEPQTPKPYWSWSKKDDQNPLVEAAENAHLLAAELRAHGMEAYEFHDRTESIVTVGSFDQAAGKTPQGGVLPTPAMQQVIEKFGAAFNTPSDPLSGAQESPAAQRRVEELKHQLNQVMTDQSAQFAGGLNPKYVKIMGGKKHDKIERVIPIDVHPHAIDVPKTSVSSAYAGK
jgi:hypothetical protein